MFTGQDKTAQKNAQGVIMEETKLDGYRPGVDNNAEEPSMAGRNGVVRLNAVASVEQNLLVGTESVED